MPPRPSKRPPAPLYGRLPRGPHHVQPEKVAEHQRARLQGAMVVAVTARGYERTTVKELVALAGVSNTAFYRHFDDKQGCFLSTHDVIVDEAITRISHAYREADGWDARLATAFAAFAEAIATDPEPAYLVIVESLVVGRAAIEHRARAASAFHRMFRESFEQASPRADVSDLTIRAIVGGIRSVAYRRLRRYAGGELRALVDTLLEWSLTYAQAVVPSTASSATALRNAISKRTDPDEARPRARARPPRALTRIPESRLNVGHRERILDAVTTIVLHGGYESLTIPMISTTAGVSNQTFYQHFGGKDEAFLAAFDRLAEEAFSAVSAASLEATDWPSSVHAGLGALLSYLCASPAFARFAFFELPYAGRSALGRADTLLEQWAGLIVPPSAVSSARHTVVAEAIAGGVWDVLRTELATRPLDRLPALAGPLADLVLTPFALKS